MYSHSTSKACCEIRLFLLRFILHLVSLCKNGQNLYSLTHSVPCLCSRPNVVFLFHYFISQEFESKLVASESLKEELIIRLKNTETNVEALKTADQGKKKNKENFRPSSNLPAIPPISVHVVGCYCFSCLFLLMI